MTYLPQLVEIILKFDNTFDIRKLNFRYDVLEKYKDHVQCMQIKCPEKCPEISLKYISRNIKSRIIWLSR